MSSFPRLQFVVRRGRFWWITSSDRVDNVDEIYALDTIFDGDRTSPHLATWARRRSEVQP